MAKNLASALSRCDTIGLVYGHNHPGAHGGCLAAKAAGHSGLKFVGIDVLPQEGVAYVTREFSKRLFNIPPAARRPLTRRGRFSKVNPCRRKLGFGSGWLKKTAWPRTDKNRTKSL